MSNAIYSLHTSLVNCRAIINYPLQFGLLVFAYVCPELIDAVRTVGSTGRHVIPNV